jgi:hypothetical protein
MESNTDLLIFNDEDLLGIKDMPCSDIINKNKTYYEVENELAEVKNTLSILQKQIETILQTPKQIETIYIYSLNNKMEIIDTNCKIITFTYSSPTPGMVIDIDNVKLQKCHSDYNNLNKFLQKFIHISEININISFPTTTKQTSYYMEYFNLIKNIVKLNNEIKIKISLPTIAFPFECLEDIFEDIIIENIKTIHISYQNREDIQHTKIINRVIKKLDKNITDKIVLNVTELVLR